jgi:hypothetical protein
MKADGMSQALAEQTLGTLNGFVRWLDGYGEDSWDHQSFFAGPIGSRAKKLYYTHPRLGLFAVAPMIFCEAFAPSARLLFHKRIRFPIADAHYSMGFTYLAEATGESKYLSRASHFLDVLKQSRCANFKEYCWGYPFDWVTRNGVMAAQTPLITSTPYAYEAFLHMYQAEPKPELLEIMASIARHGMNDIKEFVVSPTASSCSYSPFDGGGVINAAAYRSFLLTSAGQLLGEPEYQKAGERNLRFVLQNQNEDGSWPYAVDGVRGFVDHFHTCFVMKALAKVQSLTGDQETLDALRKGVAYYEKYLFDTDGLPKPFSVAPRMTVYKRELYDCAECINLCLLLRDRFPELGTRLETVVSGILDEWVQDAGFFRARRLLVGWDNVPMHRWGQSQMFCSLARYLRDSKGASAPSPVVEDSAALPN